MSICRLSVVPRIGKPNVAICFLMLLLALTPAAVAVKTTYYDSPRLPTALVPFHYELHLLTRLENTHPIPFSFEGAVNISFFVHKSTDVVVLHANEFSIKLAKTQLQEWYTLQRLAILEFNFNRKLDYLIMKADSYLKQGKYYSLTIEFGRPMSENKRGGYFLAHSTDSLSHQKSWYSLTHFEPQSMRYTMPCFDEPALKATFNVTLGHHKRFQSFSNMKVTAVLAHKALKDYVWSVHETTPLMPNYLLAFSINNLTCTFSQTGGPSPVLFRTCAKSSDLRLTTFAAQMAPVFLEYFEELLQMELPLSKIDQLAVENYPTDAMENWGLVVYSSDLILQTDEPGGPEPSRPRLQALQVICHEMAHMWFGNLISVAWWSDFWLKEGLTGYFEVLGIEHLYPRLGRRILAKYRVMSLMHETESGGIVISSMDIQSNASKTYVYQKATSVLHMAEGMVGHTTFHNAIHRYLYQYAFASSTTNQFLSSIQEGCDRANSLPEFADIKTIMDTWILQSGYPVLNVRRNASLVLTQNHFSFNESRRERWWIPLTYTTQSEQNFSDTRPKAFFPANSLMFNLNVFVPENDWIIFNVQAMGYYRVNYDERNWDLIAEALSRDHQSIHVLNRAQIVGDALFLWNTKRISWSTALNVLKYLVDEDEFEPLMALVVGVTNGFWGVSPESSMNIAKWLSNAGKWYAEFINYTFDQLVFVENNVESAPSEED
ncbi:thyrotropin-releasing hormone-degrading ectoenzyme [Drosophila guanche]|uniref:Blast:Thyrotropin-releasing hormone-degrading ectoenzyme n=1 Tax=Drosophila guanche TaxID=7266 RepID=A0A3B0KBL4_DROGU|nr:thyrotropin-releasing hormone-degrading ectoenzyme [Drosophila guanche]SPP82441.1 blast:Thyrotropin-releasing hormone-degrading ectoenzyme [Drosophila guanche]